MPTLQYWNAGTIAPGQRRSKGSVLNVGDINQKARENRNGLDVGGRRKRCVKHTPENTDEDGDCPEYDGRTGAPSFGFTMKTERIGDRRR